MPEEKPLEYEIEEEEVILGEDAERKAKGLSVTPKKPIKTQNFDPLLKRIYQGAESETVKIQQENYTPTEKDLKARLRKTDEDFGFSKPY